MPHPFLSIQPEQARVSTYTIILQRGPRRVSRLLPVQVLPPFLLEAEVEKMNKFTADVLGMQNEIKIPKMDVRGCAKYVLKNGASGEKRELLSCLKSRLILSEGALTVV